MSKLAAIIMVFCIALPALADTRYISDELQVPLRSSPCSRCAIVRVLKAGTRLNLIESNKDGWSHVTADSDLEGWLPSQYLVSQPIARDRLAAAQSRAEQLASKNDDLAGKVNELQQQNQQLQQQLSAVTGSKTDLKSELARIKQASANALSLQSQNQELLKRNRILQSEIDVLTASRDQLRGDRTQRWFLYGGLTVFLAAVLVALIPRLKPRKRFSEWA